MKKIQKHPAIFNTKSTSEDIKPDSFNQIETGIVQLNLLGETETTLMIPVSVALPNGDEELRRTLIFNAIDDSQFRLLFNLNKGGK